MIWRYNLPKCPVSPEDRGEEPSSTQDATALAEIIKDADWYAEMDAHSGLAFHLARYWPEIRSALRSALSRPEGK